MPILRRLSSAAYAGLSASSTPVSKLHCRTPSATKNSSSPSSSKSQQQQTPQSLHRGGSIQEEERVSFFDFLTEEVPSPDHEEEDTTPTNAQSARRHPTRSPANAASSSSRSSPNLLGDDAADSSSAVIGKPTAEVGEESVGSRTLEDNALESSTQQGAPNEADKSLIMTDEDFLEAMAGFDDEDEVVDDGDVGLVEGEVDYRGEGAEMNGVDTSAAPHNNDNDNGEYDGDHSDSELMLMEEETTQRTRRVRALAKARSATTASALSNGGGAARNRELSRSATSTSANKGRSTTSQRDRLDSEAELSSFGGGRVGGGVLFSDDEQPNGGSGGKKKNGFELHNGTLGRTNEQNNNLNSDIELLQAEKQDLLETIAQLDGKIEEAKHESEEEIEKHRKLYDDLTTESVAFRGRIELLETENMRFRDKERMLRDQFQAEAELSKQLREQLDTLQQDHDELLARFQQVTQDYDTVSDDFDRLKSVATSQLQNAGELYSERVRELNNARNELSDVTSQRDTARLELEDALNTLNSQQALKNRFQERAQHLEEANQKLEHERESLVSKLNEYRRIAEQTSSELQSAVQLKEQFMNELIEQKEEVSRLHDHLDEQEAGRGRAAQLEDSMAGLAAENRALKSRLFDDSEQIRKLTGENGELLSYVDQLLKESNR